MEWSAPNVVKCGTIWCGRKDSKSWIYHSVADTAGPLFPECQANKQAGEKRKSFPLFWSFTIIHWTSWKFHLDKGQNKKAMVNSAWTMIWHYQVLNLLIVEITNKVKRSSQAWTNSVLLFEPYFFEYMGKYHMNTQIEREPRSTSLLASSVLATTATAGRSKIEAQCG